MDFSIEFQSCINFLNSLKENNNREWFNDNKKLYEANKQMFEQIVASLLKEISSFDEQVKALKPSDYIFRIYRDVRFSHDKRPYKEQFGAFITKSGKGGKHSGYYLHIEPQKSMVAGGSYCPQPPDLKLIRQEVFYNNLEFNNIINDKSFVSTYQTLDDYKLKRVPKGFPADDPRSESVKYNSYVVSKLYSDDQIVQPEFFDMVVSNFKNLKGFVHFINNALELKGNE